MERNTVIGKAILDLRWRIADLSFGENNAADPASVVRREIRGPLSTIRNHRGFSLLELMIAMFILIILLSVAFPTYQRSVQHARETVLKENLWQMRRAIDQFTADKGKAPKSIDELVEGKYLREKPRDPVSEKDEWNEIQGEDVLNPEGELGLQDVKSLSEGEDSEGKPYKDY